MFSEISNILHLFKKQIALGVSLGILITAIIISIQFFHFNFSFLILNFSFSNLLSPLPDPPEYLSPLPDQPSTPNLNPRTAVLGQTVPHQERQIIGFLPFWNLKTINDLPLDKLTHIYYFGLAVNPDGSFQKTMDDNTAEPGWHRLHQDETKQFFAKAKSENKKIGLVLRAMNNETIETVINNQTHRQHLIKNTLPILEEFHFDDLNIDFEYTGPASTQTVKNFTQFIRELKTSYPLSATSYQITIDVLADSAYKLRLYDIKALSQTADKIIIMAYDFHRPRSPFAGPVAPLFGAPQKFEYDVFTTVIDFLKLAPKEKLILALPVYGYDWQTPHSQIYSFNKNPQNAAVSSYKRSKKLIKEKNISIQWDSISKTPWFAYFEKPENSWRQVYFENERSLSLKFDLINQANLAGTALWALGYDGSHEDFWQILADKF